MSDKPELYLDTASAHSRPELAIIFATRTLCQAHKDCGTTASYREVLNTLFVVCSITILLPSK